MRKNEIVSSLLSFFSLKYVILDPSDVTKYGIYQAIDLYNINKVINNIKEYTTIEKWNWFAILKVVDFIPFSTYQQLSLLNKVEIVSAVGMTQFILMQPYPDEESRLDVVVRPFQIPVWI